MSDFESEGAGCHAGSSTLAEAAKAAGKSDLLEKYKKDYPMGPHDKPQSMCPAFGSLRVGLRMRRVGTILSGSACCVYGLTFVSLIISCVFIPQIVISRNIVDVNEINDFVTYGIIEDL